MFWCYLGKTLDACLWCCVAKTVLFHSSEIHKERFRTGVFVCTSSFILKKKNLYAVLVYDFCPASSALQHDLASVKNRFPHIFSHVVQKAAFGMLRKCTAVQLLNAQTKESSFKQLGHKILMCCEQIIFRSRSWNFRASVQDLAV